MATLKDHQKAMVDLLANGSAIPASASRLAHAMHDVLGLLLERDSEPHRAPVDCRVSEFVDGEIREVTFGDATPPPSFTDSILAADVDALSSVGGRQRDSMLIENLRADLANMKMQRNQLIAEVEARCAQYEEVVAENERLKGYLNRGLVGIGEWQVVKGK